MVPDCAGIAPFVSVAAAQTFDPMIEVAAHCLLYGLDRAGTQVHVVNLATDRFERSVEVGTGPADMTLSPDGTHVIVAVAGESKLVDLDAATGAVLKEVVTQLPPWRIAHGPDRVVYYVAETGFTALHEVDMRSEFEQTVTGVDFHEPALLASRDGLRLFVGESNLAGSELFRYDSADFTYPSPGPRRYLFDGGFGQPVPRRTLSYSPDVDRIYYADRAFDSQDLSHVRGWLGAPALAGHPRGDIVSTATALYDATAFLRFADRRHPNGGVLFSDDGLWLYEFDGIGSLLYRTSVATLVGVYPVGATQVAVGTLGEHAFTLLVADPDPTRPYLYGLDSQRNQVVFIDRTTLQPVRAEIVGSAPTDIAIAAGADLMVVATFGATEVAVIDLANTIKPLKTRLTVPGNPFRITVADDGRVVYSEQDQMVDITMVDAETGTIGATAPAQVYQGDVAFDAAGEFLYVGEAATDAAYLYRVDTRTIPMDFANATVTAAPYAFPVRQVIVNGAFVYYAGRQFDAVTLAELATFGDDIVLVTPDGRYAISQSRIYATNCACEVAGLPANSPLVAVDPASQTLYQFDNATGALFERGLP